MLRQRAHWSQMQADEDERIAGEYVEDMPIAQGISRRTPSHPVGGPITLGPEESSIRRDAECPPSRRLSLPYARRLVVSCKSTPRGRKHYQHDDDGRPYDRYCRSDLQCGVWRKC